MIVLDDTTLTALVQGHHTLARWAATVADHPEDRLYAPALSLVATTQTLGAGEGAHVASTVGALPGVYVSPLDFAGATVVEDLVRMGVPWQAAHAVHVARTAPVEGLERSLVVTSTVGAYRGTGCVVADLRRL